MRKREKVDGLEEEEKKIVCLINTESDQNGVCLQFISVLLLQCIQLNFIIELYLHQKYYSRTVLTSES